MAARQDIQLEKLMEDLSKSRNLDQRLFQRMTNEGKSLKCSKHFLSKLDKLVCMTLDQQAVTSATLCLDVIGKHGKNLQVAGYAPGLVGIINQGLVEKWFGKCRLIWIQCGPNWNPTLLNLCEDFLDTLIEVHGSCRKGTCDVSESFLYLLGDLVVDARIYILIRKEAIRKFNILLDKIPAALKKTMLSSKETSDMMIKLAAQILDNGDYDFQTALVESLCRMVTSSQRRQLADQWFCSSHVANAFVKICDSDFETDCRKFLNLINGMQGDMRRVYSYPCLETFLDKCELLMPLDNKLEDFWVDFNVGSHSISFYFCSAEDEAQGGQWETLSVIENEVESYSVTENGKSKVLKIHLLDVLNLGSMEGSSLSIHFSRSLDILQAVWRIFGKNKQKGFIAKKGTSVAKTEIHIQMVDNSSQAVIPESQTSLVESQNNSAPYCLPSSLDSEQATAKRRNSESTTFIKSTGDGSRHKSRILSKVCQKRDSQDVPDEKAVETVQEKQPNKHSQEDCVVPDTQPMPGQHTSTRWRKQSVSEVIMMPTQKMTSVPSLESCSVSENSAKIRADSPNSVLKMSIPNSSPINQKMLHSKLTQKLQDVLIERNGNILPQDPPKHQNMVLNVVENFVEECFTSMAPQKEKNSLYTKTKGQQVKQNVPFEAKKQTRSRKSLQKKADTAGKNKEKRNAEVAGNMVKNISSHYEYNSRLEKTQKISQLLMPPLNIRPVFNTSWSSNLKTEQFGGLSINKSRGNLQKERDDAFAFNVEAHSSSKQRNLKRNLFSDTDTENINTDVSWLEGSVKRPEIAKYCRQAPSKTKAVLTSRKTANHQDSPQASPMPIRGKPRKSLPQASKMKPRQQQNKPAKSAAGVEQPPVTRRRPSRAAATNNKSYRELDTDDSQSATEYLMHHETDGSACWRKKTKSKPSFPSSSPKTSMDFPLSELKTEKKRSEDAGGRKSTDWNLDRKNQNESKSLFSIYKLRPDYSPDGTERMDNISLSFQDQTHDLKGPKASRCASGSSSIEKVLHADRSSQNVALSISLPTSPTSPPPLYSDHPYNNSLSVTVQVPKPHSSVSSRKKVKSPCGRKKSSSIHSIHSLSPLTCHSPASLPCVNLKKGSRKFPPPPKSPTPHPPLRSTLLEQEQPLMPSAPPSLREAAIHRDCRCSFSASSVSQSQSSCRSSLLPRRVMETFPGGNAGSHLQEKTCSNDDRTPEPFVSGPCAGPASSSESEAEKRKKNKSKSRSELRMKPRKLFKSFTELSAAAEMSQAMSITVSPKAAGGADEDFEFDGEEEVEEMNVKPNICKQLNFELKKKCQMRSKMMELYNQQSLKTVQQHVSSFNIDVHKDRTQRLEEVEKILLGEIKKLEQEDLTLKTMEKDLILYWKKQSKSLHSYREQETKRNETLKTVLQGTMCQSLQYEERKFTSQMALMRKDLKSVQDRLMTDMQEKEIRNIKHSLHALFYPGGGGI